jgi:hypothetical protein
MCISLCHLYNIFSNMHTVGALIGVILNMDRAERERQARLQNLNELMIAIKVWNCCDETSLAVGMHI